MKQSPCPSIQMYLFSFEAPRSIALIQFERWFTPKNRMKSDFIETTVQIGSTKIVVIPSSDWSKSWVYFLRIKNGRENSIFEFKRESVSRSHDNIIWCSRLWSTSSVITNSQFRKLIKQNWYSSAYAFRSGPSPFNVLGAIIGDVRSEAIISLCIFGTRMHSILCLGKSLRKWFLIYSDSPHHLEFQMESIHWIRMRTYLICLKCARRTHSPRSHKRHGKRRVKEMEMCDESMWLRDAFQWIHIIVFKLS